MNSNETYFPDLITRYLSGEATPEEIRELSVWVFAAPENTEVFLEYRQSWLAVTARQIEEHTDIAREWKELQQKLSGTTPEKKAPEPASPVPPLSRPPAMEEKEGRVIRMDPAAVNWRVTLLRVATIAAIILVLLIPTWIAIRYFTRTEVTKLTASEEILESVLPDGSFVALNAFSTLTYPEGFGRTNREVTLTGEALFGVNPDPGRPFIISSGTARVEVLGTSFYVKALDADTHVEVVLIEGSLTVYFEEARSTGKRIVPGEKAELHPENQRIIISPNENPNFLAWKTKHLVFLDDPLDVVINTLNSVYHANLSLAAEHLRNCRLTVTFDRQSLESVLSVIEATLDLRSETTPSGIILYGQGCN